jgi:6-phosphogluconolactonase
MSQLEHVVLADAPALATDVAARTVAVLGAALEARDIAHLVVTGGSILDAVLAELADPARLDWSRVHVWWGDERFVPVDSDDRNDLPAAFAALPVTLHRMAPSGGEYGDDVEAAAAAYADELARFADGDTPSLDVALIGVGPDGHCCSLFPHHPGLQVLDRSVAAVFDSPKPPPTRITLTFPTLDAIRELWFVVSGDGKADAVAHALGGSPREETPSGSARGTGHTLWLIDEAAAGKL